MADATVAMIACYRIRPEERGAFLDLLRETEQVYREHEVITEGPIMRLQSRQDPGYLLEIIEWRSLGVVAAIQESEPIQEMWSRIKAAWLHGDFPISELPEATIPWAILDVVR